MKNKNKVIEEFKLEELEQRIEFSFWCDQWGDLCEVQDEFIGQA